MSSLFKNVYTAPVNGEFNAVAESAFTDNAICDLTMELFHIAECADIAGIVGGYAVQEGTAQADVLLENIIKTSYGKMKEAFKKFAAKMKAFFEQVRKVLKTFFLKGKDFVKEYKVELTKKSVKGFKYTGYKYNISAGDVASDKMFNAVESGIDTLLSMVMGSPSSYKELLDDEVAFKQALAKATSVDSKDGFADDVAKTLAKVAGLSGVSDITELKQELATLYRGKAANKEQIEDFEGTSVSDMITFIEQSDSKIKSFDKDEKDFDKTIGKIIKVIDKLDGTKGETDEETNAYKLMSKLSSKLTTYLNSGKAPIDVKVAIYKEAASQYESVLKSFLRHRAFRGPVKENTSVTEGMSLVEQMLGL